MTFDNEEDKNTFANSISYFEKIIRNNITDRNYSTEKMGATFLGIKTNINGEYKLHIYIILFPFMKQEGNCPYSNDYPNIFLKDIQFQVGEEFYVWVYEEMKKQNSMVIFSLNNNILKVVDGFGDGILLLDKKCNEQKEWMELEFELWYEKKIFNNIFTIQIVNPYLYLVPFPVKPIFLKTKRILNNYCQLIT